MSLKGCNLVNILKNDNATKSQDGLGYVTLNVQGLQNRKKKKNGQSQTKKEISKVHKKRKINLSLSKTIKHKRPRHVSKQMETLCKMYFGENTSDWQKIKFSVLGYPKSLTTVKELITICNKTLEKNNLTSIKEDINLEGLISHRIVKETLRKRIDGKYHNFLKKFMGLKKSKTWYDRGQDKIEELYVNPTKDFTKYLDDYEKKSNHFYSRKKGNSDIDYSMFIERDGEKLKIRMIKKRKRSRTGKRKIKRRGDTKKGRKINGGIKKYFIREVTTIENTRLNNSTTRTRTTEITVKDEIVNNINVKTIDKKKTPKQNGRRKPKEIKFDDDLIMSKLAKGVDSLPFYIKPIYRGTMNTTIIDKDFDNKIKIVMKEVVYSKVDTARNSITRAVSFLGRMFPKLKEEKAIERLAFRRKGIKFILAKVRGSEKVLGAIMYRLHSHPMACEVLLMAVDGKSGRKGIGSFMMDRLKVTLPPFYHVIVLKADLYSGCVTFYEKNGFTKHTTLKFGKCFFDTTGSIHMECRREKGGFRSYQQLKNSILI